MKRKTLKERCEENGISWGAFCYRHYSMGRDLEESLTKPVMTKDATIARGLKMVELKKQGKSSRDIGRVFGVTPECVNWNLRRYMK